MKTRWARRTLAGLAALGAIELFVSAFVYRDAIDDADWDTLAAHLEADDADAIRLATGWLGPRARMEVPALAAPSSAAGPDLHGIETLTVVGLGEAWSDALDRELEGSLRPGRVSVDDVGPFTVARYRFEHAPRTLHDWTERPPSLRTPQGSCRGKGRGWACKEGNVSVAFAEVDYVPRRCLTTALSDNTPLTLESKNMELGTSLRGHLGITDFNGRLRSDAPVRVQTWIDDVLVGTFTVTDAQGWRTFVVRTEPGLHDVRVAITDTVRGTWGRAGLDPRGARKVCFELRALGEAP
ncbi:MAG: hypothetical protein ACE37F_07880 [Nannocystaceae bacterium]|nr:hypothetical protein [bacterium]